MDNDLLCNFRKCRKRLSKFAWGNESKNVLDTVKDIFCDEDGTKEFNKSLSCPACETSLSGKFDVIRVDLQASEQYKSMVLAGQRPEVIMEIASRALAFWTYQTHQEKMYQDYVANKAKEKISQLEQYYEQILTKAQAEITYKTSELEDTKKRYNEVSEKMMEKNRQYLKLQGMYDSLRRKSITPAVLEGREERFLDSRLAHMKNTFDLPLGTSVDLPQRASSFVDLSCNAEREFVMDAPIPQQDRVGTPSHRALNETALVPSRFNIDFIGTPGISKRLGQRGN